MTFLELKQRMARRTGKNSTTLDPYTSARFTDFLDEAHKDVLRAHGREQLRYAVVPFASVAGRTMSTMPTSGITRINRIIDPVNDRRLEYHTADWLDTVSPDPQSGTPWAWVPHGYADVQQQPVVTPARLWAYTHDARDATKQVIVEGIANDGHYFRTMTTMVPFQSVEVATNIPVHEVHKFYASAPLLGGLQLIAANPLPPEAINPAFPTAPQQGLAYIAFGTRSQYFYFQLYPTPTAVITYTANVLRGVPLYLDDSDEPLLPPDFHEILVPMALLREFTKSDDPQRWEQMRLEARRGLQELDTFLTAHPDFDVKWGGPELQYSTLGAWFPAGS